MTHGDYVIGPNPGHGRIISTAEVLMVQPGADGFLNGQPAVDIGTALVKWTDGTHGRYPRSELRVVEFRPQPDVFPGHKEF